MSFLSPIVSAVSGAVAKKGAQEGAKQVAKKKISKTKKAAVLGGVVLGGKAIIGSDGKPVEAGATGISTSDANAAAMQQAGNLVGMSGQGVGLAGLPIGSEIAQGGKAQLSKGAGALQFAALQPADRAQLILRLGQIPGLYAKGQAPTPGFIQGMISGKDVVPRPQDFAALEQVTAFAEWSGTNIQNTVTKLISQPGLAQQYFGKITTTPKAVTSSKALESEFNNKFLDLFETSDPALAKSYAKEVNKLESTTGISTQQKEDILLKYVQKKATDQFNLGQTGMVKGATDKGALGRTVRSIRAAYEDNGIPINEKDVYNKAVQSLRSPEAYKNVLDNVMMQASVVMPAFKDFFSQGKTAREVLSPWINTRAQVLGIPADQIKVSDMYDIGSGTAPKSIQDYKKELYRSPEYKKTDAYKERSLGDLQTLLKAFNIG
jgi:hypothetical protein